MKIHQVGAEFTNAEGRTDTDRHTDRHRHRQTDTQTDRQIQTDRHRQTDMTKLIVAFRNFANASKSCLHECGPIFVSVAVKPYKTVI
jgi:hypothetical protein